MQTKIQIIKEISANDVNRNRILQRPHNHVRIGMRERRDERTPDRRRRWWDGRSWEVRFSSVRPAGVMVAARGKRRARGPEKTTENQTNSDGTFVDDQRRLPRPFLPSIATCLLMIRTPDHDLRASSCTGDPVVSSLPLEPAAAAWDLALHATPLRGGRRKGGEDQAYICPS